jgi:AhpD family alkylhydroperoxidase
LDAKNEGLDAFNTSRKELNQLVLSSGHTGLKRFWALDSRAYKGNTLEANTLVLLGLATSLVLRCDDCVTFHIIRCIQLGLTDEELHDALNVALVVGGSITIPHLRRAFKTIEDCRKLQQKDPDLKTLLE